MNGRRPFTQTSMASSVARRTMKKVLHCSTESFFASMCPPPPSSRRRRPYTRPDASRGPQGPGGVTAQMTTHDNDLRVNTSTQFGLLMGFLFSINAWSSICFSTAVFTLEEKEAGDRHAANGPQHETLLGNYPRRRSKVHKLPCKTIRLAP